MMILRSFQRTLGEKTLSIAHKRVSTNTRSFFASSTDHTTLLSNAYIHRSTADQDGKYSYILIPDGTDVELALKVDKLHLARLFVNHNHCIYGAKVVQKSLGSCAQVCKPLLHRALQDIRSASNATRTGIDSDPDDDDDEPVATALASLDGLSKWVVGGIDKKHHIQTLEMLRQSDDPGSYEACVAIATGIPRSGHSVVGQGTYRDGQVGWSQLAKEYVDVHQKCDDQGESLLYQENGGQLVSIDHLADVSREGLMGAGGSMARFQFSSNPSEVI